MKDNCKELIPTIGKKISPQRKVEIGEDTLCKSHNASSNGFPDHLIAADSIQQIIEEINFSEKGLRDNIPLKRRYLWVVSENKINIAYEALPSKAKRGCICHTNITGNEDAVIGGELWFLKEDDTFVLQINFSSGRYPIKKQAELLQKEPIEIMDNVIALFKCVGYASVSLIRN